MNEYVSLHNHTTFSILDSLVKPADLFKKAKELGQTAIAITDHGTLAAMWDSLKEAKSTGVKLIPGCEFYFVDDVSNKEARMRHVILLSKNEIGYRHLLEASAEGYDNLQVFFKRVFPRIDWKVLEKYSEGLICLTACSNGILGQLINQKKYDEAKEGAVRLKKIFGDDLGIELQAHALKRVNNAYSGEIDQQFTNDRLRDIALELDIKCVVSTDVHYLNPEQAKAHDVLLAISSGSPVDSGNRLRYSGANGILSDFYLKSGEEVYNKLNRQFGRKDPEFAHKCIENTKYFADKCEFPEWIDPKYSNPSGKELPEFPVKDQEDYGEFQEWLKENNVEGKAEDAMYLRYRCEKGLLEKVPVEKHDEYRKRLEEEYDVLEFKNFSSYMLIVMDYVEWAKKQGIFVSYGRGSAGGTLVAYLIGIHIADPIKYKLIFARFLNKEKGEPDIDVDFPSSERERVKNYIRAKYGEDRVAHVSNMNTMTPKVYARAISRAFMYGGDRKTAVKVGTVLADAIPDDIHKVEDALEKAALFAEYAKPVSDNGGGYTELREYAKDIGNKVVAWSTHAGGVLIGKRPLRGLVPLRRDKDGNIAIEYTKETAELSGLIKNDVLAVETLDIVSDTFKLIKSMGREPPALIPDFDAEHKEAYDLISRGDTFGVFQLGTSGGTVELCKKVKPRCLEDISVINSLARPSAKDIRAEYIGARDSKKEVKLLHPTLERSFRPTLGFGLYEECLLYLAQDVAGWNLHSADRLRKLTKLKGKDPKSAEKWKEEFIEDAVKNNVEKEIATKIWCEIIENFQGYGFNHSHSIFYSMLGLQTAILKSNKEYFLPFMVANLKSEVGSNSKFAKDNIAKIKEEIRRLKVNIVPPDINKSETTYTIIDDHTLLTGFDALKNMGKNAIPEIIAKRPFTSFEDFLTKIDGSKVCAPSIQALAASGCLDSFGMSRKLMFLYAADYKKKLSEHLKKKKNAGISFNYPWPDEGDWTISEKCSLEKKYIGESLSGNKVQEFNGFFTYGAPSFASLPKIHPAPPETMSVAEQRKYTKRITLLQGEVKNIFEFKVKKEDSKIRGEVMAKIKLEDPHGNQMSATFFPDSWVKMQNRVSELSNNKHKLEPGVGLYMNGNLNWYNGELSIIFDDLAKFSPQPPLPADLQSKKVKLPSSRTKKNNTTEESSETTILLDELEEELIESGHADLDDEEDNNTEFR